MAERLVPAISLRDFENRKQEIISQLVDAAENSGFLTLVDHGITVEEIEAQFALSKTFFGLSLETKHATKFDSSTSLGFEYKSQKRATTGVDQKESLLIQPNHHNYWPRDEDVPNFKATTELFLAKCATISQQVLQCFAIALGFQEDYFRAPMDALSPDSLNQLRFLHYFPSEKQAQEPGTNTFGAGTHTDFGCLTLLFQQSGGDGLEICPGRESHTSGALGDTFFPIPANTGPIVVNIGDMLMSWSDDRFKATFHRVCSPKGKSPDRYSIAYFNQGRDNFMFQGPLKKYEPVTCGDYVHRKLASFFKLTGKDKKNSVVEQTRELPALVAAAT
ncbi:Clavaminate synthase-like protein [Pleurostoma richardsiae]|uniref:Clavaminate synthase-like protein n=1 Tax=Pleurostoma richardsiae TaxID=41990 RepID=A0AA38RSX1_9PEZI|nr:Clavaminate synthase-like protein [Pleurostoma richardsiae]